MLGNHLAKGRGKTRVVENERPVEDMEFVLYLAYIGPYYFQLH